MEYFGNLFFKSVVDGEQEPGEPKADRQMKKYLFSSKLLSLLYLGNRSFLTISISTQEYISLKLSTTLFSNLISSCVIK